MDLKEKLEMQEIGIDEQASLSTWITYDEKTYILEISYLDGKFVAEKFFSTDFDGVAKMEEEKNKYKNENDVKRYFGIL